MAGERSDAPTGAGPNKAAVKKHDVFGITEVDAEEWETWLKGNKDSNLVKKHFLFAAPSMQEIDRPTTIHRKVKMWPDPPHT
jgi:hypothetical protein